MHTEATGDTLRVSGITELTAGSARDVKDEIRSRLENHVIHIDFDASALSFLDSSGLGTLISLQKLAAERQGHFRLLAPTPPAMQVLELTRLHRVFEIVP
ncbi:anti-sigma B factor antagonist [Haloferula luteola]|uniref:Anti-sigma B factor antagonist n=1 Tax=Haloferula luteola TaxID=595692 RepID=A0A840V5I1_9BACT|nr:STAS domain-containing protein [Haloferula luteola]MBB5350884.1 anti-sigma B factor antagonist [Haloferula luteola]